MILSIWIAHDAADQAGRRNLIGRVLSVAWAMSRVVRSTMGNRVENLVNFQVEVTLSVRKISPTVNMSNNTYQDATLVTCQ